MGKASRSPFSPRTLIDRYFLEEENPYSKRKPIKMKTLAWSSIVSLILFVIGVMYFGGSDERKGEAVRPDFHVLAAAMVQPTTQSPAIGGASRSERDHGTSSSGFLGLSLGSGVGGSARSTQTHSASQVIRRGVGGNDPGAAIPLGSAIPVRLVNAVLSTDSAAPVIAEVTDDVFAHGILSIPAGTRAIGTGQYDDASSRIQLRFETLVYPEGDQHPVQAIGMTSDGSAGLDGDYHSGQGSRQVGRFLGHFIGGLADGMKDRKAAGSFGMPYEPGSVKNGILSGVSLSAEDQAKQSADDLNRTKPSMTLTAGQSFVLFLQREYVP